MCTCFPSDQLRPLAGILFDWGPSVVVSWQYRSRFDQFGRGDAVFDAHCEQIADRQDRDVDAVGVQLHVAEDRRIACKVDSSTVDGDDESGGVASTGTIGQLAAVKGWNHLDRAKWCFDRTPEVHADGRLDAVLGLEPLGDFVNRDDGCTGAFGDFCGVSDMIEMPVRDQNMADSVQFLGLHGRRRVVGQKRIEQHAVTSRFDQPASVR